MYMHSVSATNIWYLHQHDADILSHQQVLSAGCIRIHDRHPVSCAVQFMHREWLVNLSLTDDHHLAPLLFVNHLLLGCFKQTPIMDRCVSNWFLLAILQA
jgi:hypothetical protein